MKPGLSAVVCCYNSEHRLPETLAHLLKQNATNFNWEIIVVDNASTDSTSVIAENILAKKLSAEKYKVLQEIEPGLSSARRKGYQSAQYDYVLFCDDDNWLAGNYFQLAFEILEQNAHIGILGGKGEAVFEKIKPDWFDTYQINFAVGEQADSLSPISSIETSYGAGLIVRKKIFELLNTIQFESLLSDRKGNQLMSGGDTELCIVAKYLGYEICYAPSLQFKHLMTDGRMKWDYLKKLYYGFGRTRVYIQAYKMMEQASEIPGKNLRIALWLDKYLHRLSELTHFLPKHLFKLNDEGNDEALKYAALRGELYELRTLKNNYPKVFENILKTKRQIAELKK